MGILTMADRSRPGRTHDALIGTGGIGSGLVVALEGNHTLGREESRAVHLLDRQDYAKLHIISHYVKKMLGDDFDVYPIGRLGTDTVGERLTAEMRRAGLDLRYVAATPAAPTLFAVTYHYPDGDGGNLTTLSSASAVVSAEDVDAALPTIESYGPRAVALAVPETPLASRRRLLEHATRHGLLRFASFLTAEVAEALHTGALHLVDVLSLNIDEAKAVVDATGGETVGDKCPDSIERTVSAVTSRLRRLHPGLRIVITAGRHGSWAADVDGVHFAPAILGPTESTAGAGDAHLSGLIVAHVAHATLTEANQFAALVAGMKVASPHTINPAIDAASVVAHIADHPLSIAPSIIELLAPETDTVVTPRLAARDPVGTRQFSDQAPHRKQHNAH
jgi:ribokinase